jgi:hypothetical protein
VDMPAYRSVSFTDPSADPSSGRAEELTALSPRCDKPWPDRTAIPHGAISAAPADARNISADVSLYMCIGDLCNG